MHIYIWCLDSSPDLRPLNTQCLHVEPMHLYYVNGSEVTQRDKKGWRSTRYGHTYSWSSGTMRWELKNIIHQLYFIKYRRTLENSGIKQYSKYSKAFSWHSQPSSCFESTCRWDCYCHVCSFLIHVSPLNETADSPKPGSPQNNELCSGQKPIKLKWLYIKDAKMTKEMVI